MKKVIFCLYLFIFIGIAARVQTYTNEMQMESFQQVSDTEIKRDVLLRKEAGSNNWALYNMQARLEYDAVLYNSCFVNSNVGVDYLNRATTVNVVAVGCCNCI
jgi:hypothetical protein